MSQNTTVLIIDDEEQLRLAFASDLVEAGYKTIVAKDGYEALEKLRTHSIDIVLSDLKMPELNGIQVLRTMRASGYVQPFIVLSGFGTRDEIVELLRLGAFNFIEKPVQYEELCRVIGEAASFLKSQAKSREELLESFGMSGSDISPEAEKAIRQLARMRTLRQTITPKAK